MAQPSKFTMKIPDDLMKRYGKSSSHMGALLKGARARQEGKTLKDCPYDFNKAAGFFFAWSHGWIGVDTGTITFSEGGGVKRHELASEEKLMIAIFGETGDPIEHHFLSPEGLQAVNDMLKSFEATRHSGVLGARGVRIIRLRFGFEPLTDKERKTPHLSDCRTLEETGRYFGVTRERIRQIEAKTLRCLRHPKYASQLRPFLKVEKPIHFQDMEPASLESGEGTKITVHFEDLGQDFTEWDIENGIVTGCRPFQAWMWVGTKVLNTSIQVGFKLRIKIKDDKPTWLKYRVEKVETR